MPFEDVTDSLGVRGPLGQAPQPVKDYTGGQIMGAAFRQVSPVGSMLNASVAMMGIDQTPDPEFKVWDDIAGTRYQQYSDAFLNVRNRQQAAAVKARIDREDQDNAILAESGAAGFVAGMAMGMIDPTLILPGGAIYRSAKGGFSVGRSAASAAAAGAVQGAASEALLQGSQVTRRPEDWVTSIASSTVLSGLLGGGAAALLTRSERKAIELGFDEMRNSAPLATSTAPGAGAATADMRENVLVRSGMFEKIPVRLRSPTQRVMTSEIAETRRIAGDLVEIALTTEGNKAGLPNTSSGIPVDSEVKRLKAQLTFSAADEMDRLYREYRFGPQDGSMVERGINAVQGALGQETGFLSKQEFREEIAKAMRRGDRSDNPQAQAAAQFIRKNVIDPITKRAQAAGLLPEDLQVKGAESWFMRSYNRELLNANGPEFIAISKQWLAEGEAQKQEIIESLRSLNDQRAMVMDQMRRLESRMQTVERQGMQTEARLSERGMEARAAFDRVDATGGRVQSLKDEIGDLETFIAEMRRELADPEMQQALDRMAEDVADLKKVAGPISDREIKAITTEERRGTLAGDGARVADYVTGRQKLKPTQSFLSIFDEGGIYDPGGEVRAVLGEARKREPVPGLSRSGKKDAIKPGLLRAERNRNSLDDWGEKLHNRYPEIFPERPSPAELLDMIDEAARGRNPRGWDEMTGAADDRALMAYAEDLNREFDAAGIPQPKNRDEYIAALTRLTGDAPAITAAVNRKLEAIRNADDGQRALDELLADRAEGRSLIRRAMSERDTLDQQRMRAGAAEREAGIANRRNQDRLSVLEGRQSLIDQKAELVGMARANAQKLADDLQARIEERIGEYQGNSAAEAKAALRQREKYVKEAEAVGKAPGEGGRLTSADDAVNRAVKRLLAREAMDDQALQDRAEEIYARILGTPDGRMPYDISSPRTSGFVETDPMQRTGPRGSLAAREFAIPDERIEKFLNRDAENMVHTFLNTFLPDVALAEKFGTKDLTEQFKRIEKEAIMKAGRAQTEAERAAIMEQKDADIKVLAAVRDRITNTYGADFNQKYRGLARASNVMRMWNQMTLLGSAGLSSIPDMAGVVFRWGLDASTQNGWSPYLKALANPETKEALKRQKYQLTAMGIGTELATASRLRAMDNLTESYIPTSRFERGMEAATQAFFVANGQALITDFSKHMAGSVTMAEILRHSKRVVDGAASEKDLTRLAAAYIDPNMARKIWAEFSRPGAGEVIDGVYLPNLDRWTDAEARRTFEAAVMREVNIAVITPGQEKPLWMSNPVLGLIGQFKSFTAAANERLLLAQMQRHDGKTFQGIMAIMAAGALAVTASNIAADKPLPERPQDWVKEAMERSGMLGWISEVNQFTAKATSGGLDMYRLIGADKPLTRAQGASATGQLLGPTFGKLEGIRKMLGAPASEEGWTAQDTQAFRQIIVPGQNLVWIRRGFNEIEDGINRAFGIDPLDRERLSWQ